MMFDIWWLAKKIRNANKGKKRKWGYVYPLVFPITYLLITIWIILITFETNNYWMRWIAKFVGVMLGLFTAIRGTFFGEQWLAIDNLNNLSLTQFNDGFALPLGLVLVAISLVQMYMLIFSVLHAEYKEDEGE